jgi:hypothetical protein
MMLLLAGCSEAMFSDADEGATRELRQGSSFSVSLPADGPRVAGDPKIEGAFVRYLGRSSDADGRRTVYRFSADGVGEAFIHIPGGPLPPEAIPPFVMRVRITPAEKSSSAGPPQPPPGSKSY